MPVKPVRISLPKKVTLGKSTAARAPSRAPAAEVVRLARANAPVFAAKYLASFIVEDVRFTIGAGYDSTWFGPVPPKMRKEMDVQTAALSKELAGGSRWKSVAIDELPKRYASLFNRYAKKAKWAGVLELHPKPPALSQDSRDRVFVTFDTQGKVAEMVFARGGTDGLVRKNTRYWGEYSK